MLTMMMAHVAGWLTRATKLAPPPPAAAPDVLAEAPVSLLCSSTCPALLSSLSAVLGLLLSDELLLPLLGGLLSPGPEGLSAGVLRFIVGCVLGTAASHMASSGKPKKPNT